MRLRYGHLFFLILFFIIICDAAYAQGSGIGYVPADPDQIANHQNEPYVSTGADAMLQFWELPLWVQIAYLSLTAISILGLLKIMPVVLGRLKHALENPKTKEIFSFIQRNPGVTIAELSEEQNINRGTLKYHLSQLLANNKIIFIRKGKFSRLFYNTLTPLDKESIITHYLKNENSSRILLKIMDNPGISNQELSDGFDLAKSTTHEYLKNFSDDGLIDFRQDGKFKRCYLKQDVRMIMLRYRPQ